MCGIFGLYMQRGVVEPDTVARATRELTHRGPDGQKWWIAPHRRVGLGHTRLSIIDLAGGDQPLSNEDGQIRAVVNGELYDFERIQRELAGRGHTLRTGSDSEILLHLYEELGTECLRHMRGEFAFVLWDGNNDVLFAGRDRFGIKPLYYAHVGDALYLASEAKAIFAAGVAARWDRESFFQRTYLPCNPDRTLFTGILQVPPGCYLLATRNHVQIVRYWDIAYPERDAHQDMVSEQDTIEMFRDKLDEAIRLRLRADVPVGVFLSGGIDSSAILGMAARHKSDALHAFTISFNDAEYDETDIARETAAFTGASFRPIPVDPVSFAQNVSAAAWHGETVTMNSNSVARYLKARAVRDAGYKVVLCGEGADEILSGYRPLEEELLPPEERSADSPHWRSTRFGEQLAAVESILGGVPLFLRDAWFAQRSLRRVLAPDFLEEFARRNPFQVLLASLDRQRDLARWSGPHQAMYLWSKLHLSNYILYADRMEMAHGVEVRLPFLDHHLVELVQKMPLWLYKKSQKHVLREAARPYVTERVYQRPKRMFFAPPDTTGESAMRELTEDTLRSSALTSLPFFDRGEVLRMLDLLRTADRVVARSIDPAIKMVLSTCLLQERFRL
jgi:asparagine synthase (glutamine-hydrolysing)